MADIIDTFSKEELDELTNFQVEVFGNLEKITDVISKARVRIFYRGLNRNRTYISDEFAQKLIDTLPYSPVKGIFDGEGIGFTDHGIDRNEGRAYGVVANPPNFSWERHLDKDGVEREYACADVYLWTGLYEEAKLIIDSPQSMELHRKSLKGEWRMIDGKKCFYYTEGNFLGLQVLGQEVEPCFEGAAFYSLFTSVQELLEEVKSLKADYSKIDNTDNKKEEIPMAKINFKLSDGAKYEALWSLLNNEVDADGNPVFSCVICDVYDDYALTYNFESNSYERVYYTKDDENDSIVIDRKEACYILEVSEAEKNALESLRSLNGDTYENVSEKFSTIETLENTINENNTTIETLQGDINTLTEEKGAAETKISELEGELNSLKDYKKGIEDAEKQAVIEQYSAKLDEEIIKKYQDNLDTYTVLDLKKDLSFELVQAEPEIFAKKEDFVPKSNPNMDDIGDILAKYKK